MQTTNKDRLERNGWRRVTATPEEVAEWRAGHNGRMPSVYRMEHIPCGKRIWGSGLGMGAHRRACTVTSTVRGQ